MSAIPVLVVTRNPTELPAGASGSDMWIANNDGNVVVQAYNPTGSPVTVEIIRTANIASVSLPDEEQVVAAGAREWLGPFAPVVYNDDEAEVHITDPSGQLVFNGLRF